MPYVIVERRFEDPVENGDVRVFPAGWTGMVPEETAERLLAGAAGRVDADRQAQVDQAAAEASPRRARKPKADPDGEAD